jgi:serine/threonine-protein kinase RsbW
MDPSGSNQIVEIILPNILGYERIAMACSASFGQMNGLAPDRIEDLKTIVAEASTNAMQHGNEGRTEAHVAIRFEVMPDAIQVTVFDEGNGFDKEVKDPDIDRIMEQQDKPVGFGVFLIRNLSDQVEFRKNPQGGHNTEMRIDLSSG